MSLFRKLRTLVMTNVHSWEIGDIGRDQCLLFTVFGHCLASMSVFLHFQTLGAINVWFLRILDIALDQCPFPGNSRHWSQPTNVETHEFCGLYDYDTKPQFTRQQIEVFAICRNHRRSVPLNR